MSPGCNRPEVHRHVRLRARMRLDVRVLGLEECLGPVDRQLLDLVDDLAAAVVPLARVSLGVLVRRHRADRLEDRRPREVLRRDQLDLAALPLELVAEERRDVRIDLGKARGAQFGEGMSGDDHAPTMLLQPASHLRPRALSPGRHHLMPNSRAGQARAATTRASARAGSPAPAGGSAGSTPVTSITVDGVPGSSPPSTAAATPARISGGTSASVRGSGRRAGSRSSRRQLEPLDDRRSHAGEDRHAEPDRARPPLGQPREAACRIRDDERVRPGQERLHDRQHPARRARGDASRSDADGARTRPPSAGSLPVP